ncbi:MAG TPA: glycosyltransferase family 87 protein [Sphingomicrobium sp.]|nr:glycosyltransferase family 87 protein [Sphingomicrobium sp.]
MPALSQRPYALLLALVTAILTDLGLLWLYWHFGIGADFAVFWRAVRNPSPYAFSALPFGNPPTALLLLQPLKLLSFWTGLAAWNLATFGLFLVLGSRLYGHKAAMLGTISPAVVTALIAGQITMAVGALVFGAFLSGPILCGVLLGVAVCTKPQMVFLAPVLFLFSREMRPLAAFCATVVLLALVATLTYGPSIWSDWIQGMHNMLFVAKHRGALFLTISPMTYGAWIGFLSVPASLLGLYLCKGLSNSNRAAAVVAASLFAAPYSMVYDLAPLAVFAAALILRSTNWRSVSAALTYSGALGPFSIPCLWPAIWQGGKVGSNSGAETPSILAHMDRANAIDINPLPLG